MITSIIFSKDRPLQLHLSLTSILRNFQDSSEVVVIYDCSENFKEAYDILQQEFADTGVNWWRQNESLFQDFLFCIGDSKNSLISLFTDDGILFEEAPPIDHSVFEWDDFHCFSLRMGQNTTFREHEGQRFPDPPPTLHTLNEKYLAWNKTFRSYGSYWSYSISLDGHIFRKKDIFDWMAELFYLEKFNRWKSTPNVIEAQMQRFWPMTKQAMVSYPNSVYVNSPNNRVSETHKDNVSGLQYSSSADLLLKEFMDGKRIDINLLDFSNINCPHTEIDIVKGIKNV